MAEVCSIVDNIVRSKLPVEEVTNMTIGQWIHSSPYDHDKICFVSFPLYFNKNFRIRSFLIVDLKQRWLEVFVWGNREDDQSVCNWFDRVWC